MHEIRATIAPEYVPEMTRIAHLVGIERVTVSEVYVQGPNSHQKVVSVETSTPRAQAFVDAFLASPLLSHSGYLLTSRELRAIMGSEPLPRLTQPMDEPFPDIIQDLWQLSHLTPSYIGRAAGGAILMAAGVIDDNPISIVVAALILPFLSDVLAVSLGMWSRDRRLIGQGIRAVTVSTLLGLAAGATVAWFAGGPIRFTGFKSPLSSLVTSTVIGTAAGLSTADDAGRRFMIGVAAAVQLSIFPVWLGAAFVLGLPSNTITGQRLLAFVLNLTSITGSALLAYAALHLRRRRK